MINTSVLFPPILIKGNMRPGNAALKTTMKDDVTDVKLNFMSPSPSDTDLAYWISAFLKANMFVIKY